MSRNGGFDGSFKIFGADLVADVGVNLFIKGQQLTE